MQVTAPEATPAGPARRRFGLRVAVECRGAPGSGAQRRCGQPSELRQRAAPREPTFRHVLVLVHAGKSTPAV